MKVNTLVALGYCCALTLLGADAATVEWPKGVDVSRAERRLLEEKALQTLAAVGKDAQQYERITVRIEPRNSFHSQRDIIEMNFWTGQRILSVAYLGPQDDGVRYVWDEALEYRNARDTDKPVKTTEERALKRAKEIARLIGRVNLDEEGKWQLFCKGFVRKDWLFHWRPLIGGYPAPSQVFVQLADDDNLGLVRYQNAVYNRPEVKTDVKINRQDARKRADQYLERYYRKNELRTLEFSTNVLEIVIPNYAFTPQDTGYEGWANPTNPAVLVWKAIYTRKNNTIEQTPVQIWVDATDGSMRGGWE